EVGEGTFDRDITALIRALELKLGRPSAVNSKLIAVVCAVVLLLGITGASVVLLPHLWVSSPTPTPTPLPSTPSPTPSPSGENPPPSSINFEPIGKWTVSTGGATAGSMLL